MKQEVRRLAEQGFLEEARTGLEELLSCHDCDSRDRAEYLLLFGRCQLGLLASAQALIALDAAAEQFRALGEDELVEYCRALRLRHLLDERDNTAVLQATERLDRLCAENDWPLAHSVARLYCGLTLSEQRRYTDAAACYLDYLRTEDPRRLPWEMALAVQSLKNAVLRGGLDPGLLDGYAGYLELASQPRIPRLFIMDQIQYVVTLMTERKLEEGLAVLTGLRVFLENSSGEWAGRLRFISTVESNLGYVCQHLYRHEEAIRHYDRAIELSRERGLLYSEHLALFNKAIVLLWSNEPAAALDCLMRSRRHFRQQQDYVSQLCDYYYAVAQLASGQPVQARETWAGRREFEVNAETVQAMSTLSSLLTHLFLKDAQTAAEVRETAAVWLAEITPEPDPGE